MSAAATTSEAALLAQARWALGEEQAETGAEHPNLRAAATRLRDVRRGELECPEALLAIGRAQAESAQRSGGEGPTTITPMAFDFDAEPEPPDWLVDRVYERGTVNLLSGDTGSAKSYTAAALAVAAVKGGDWLGHRVMPTKVMYVDRENPPRVVRRRLAALGMTNDAMEDLRYFGKDQSIAIDDPEYLALIRAEVEAHGIGLLIVDTTTSATNADLNDNRAVADVFKALQPLAGELDLTVLLVHHERKRQADVKYDPSQAAQGARAWANQPDAHTTITRRQWAEEVEVDGLPEGHRRLRSEFVFNADLKGRMGEPSAPELVALESEVNERGRLLWATVKSEGPVDAKPAEADAAGEVARVVGAADEPMGRKAIAEAMNEKKPGEPSGTFKRALEHALAKGWIARDGRSFVAGQEPPPPSL